ncbi:hypothetical protein QB607_003272 [Clostridium botulinum]|nr:hypothetical protein [Clostridium botulinum]EKS4395944.1 hypothetical protein [Clostridium botulinum]
MNIRKWTSSKKVYKLKVGRKQEGDNIMEMANIRKDKVALKALLMKDIKTDNEGRALLTKEDEWRKETEWDELYEETKKQ